MHGTTSLKSISSSLSLNAYTYNCGPVLLCRCGRTCLVCNFRGKLAWRWSVTAETCGQISPKCNYCFLFDVCCVLTVRNTLYRFLATFMAALLMQSSFSEWISLSFNVPLVQAIMPAVQWYTLCHKRCTAGPSDYSPFSLRPPDGCRSTVRHRVMSGREVKPNDSHLWVTPCRQMNECRRFVWSWCVLLETSVSISVLLALSRRRHHDRPKRRNSHSVCL